MLDEETPLHEAVAIARRAIEDLDRCLPIIGRAIKRDGDWQMKSPREQVLKVIRDHGVVAKKDLVRITQGTPHYVRDAVIDELISDGIVKETVAKLDRPGRPKTIYSITPDGKIAEEQQR